MAKRLFDLGTAILGLILMSPLLLLVASGIALTSPGPVLYRARRIGRNGEPFTMHKFRTMHHDVGGAGSPITGTRDPRVFAFGSFLRRWKIDEIPQLYDVLLGKMTIVGPRPEDAWIVQEHYTPWQWETLRVAPGLMSPGSVYNYTHGDGYLEVADPEQAYLQELLPLKLAIEEVYLRHASFWYDLTIIARTVWALAGILVDRQRFPDPPEMAEARQILESQERAGVAARVR